MSRAALAYRAKSLDAPKQKTAVPVLRHDEAHDSRERKPGLVTDNRSSSMAATGPQWSIAGIAMEGPGRSRQGSPTLPGSVRRALDSSRGERLPDSVDATFSRKFQRDLGYVTVHRDAEASEAVRSIDANAFARGSKLFFRDGAFQPNSVAGQALLAHELTHVVQQTGSAHHPSGRQTGAEEYARNASEAHRQGSHFLDAGPATAVSVAADNGVTYEDDEAQLSVGGTPDYAAEAVLKMEAEAARKRSERGGTDAETGRLDEKALSLRDTIRTAVTSTKDKKPKRRNKAKRTAAAASVPNKSLDLQKASSDEVESNRHDLAKAEILNPDAAERQRLRRAIENTEAAAPGAQKRDDEAARNAEIKSLGVRIASLRNGVDMLEQIADEMRDDWKQTSSIGTGLPRVLGRAGDVLQKEDFRDAYVFVARAGEALKAGKLSEADDLIREGVRAQDDLESRLGQSHKGIETGGLRAIKLVSFPDRVVRAALPPGWGAAYSFLQDSLQQNFEVAHGLRDSVDYVGNAVNATWGAVLNKVSGGVGAKFAPGKSLAQGALRFVASSVFSSAVTGESPIPTDPAAILGMFLGNRLGPHGESGGAGEGRPSVPQPDALPPAPASDASPGAAVVPGAPATSAAGPSAGFALPFADFAPTRAPAPAVDPHALSGATDAPATTPAAHDVTAASNDATAKPADAPHAGPEVLGEALSELGLEPADSDHKLALGVGKERQQHIEEGKKNFVLDRAMTFDIDEVLPVGQKDIKPQRAVDRALSAENRQLLDPNTNQRTKGLGIDKRELPSNRTPREPVSVSKDPHALLTHRFSEIHEMKSIFDQAVASIKEPNKMKPTELKAAINRETRRIIAEGKGPDAVAVRKALDDIGFERKPGIGFALNKNP